MGRGEQGASAPLRTLTRRLPVHIALLLAGLHAVPGTATAQQCVDYGDYLRVIGQVETDGPPMAIALAGRHALVAVPTGLDVVDVADPGAPTIAGHVGTPGFCSDVAVSGSFAYAADSNVGLDVIDISRPTDPVHVGRLNKAIRAWRLAVAGSHVLVVTDELLIVDASNPAAPFVAGSLARPRLRIVDVAAAGDLACVIGEYSEPFLSLLLVLDISDPEAPTVISHLVTGSRTGAVAMVGRHVYVTADDYSTHDSYMMVVDISSPRTPIVVGRAASSGWDIAVDGNRVYVGGGGIIDVADPASPVFLGHIPDTGSAVAAAGDLAFTARYGRFCVVDVAHTSRPSVLARINVSDVWDLAVAEGYLYVGNRSLRVFGLSNPLRPALVSTTPLPANALAIQGRLLYAGGDGVFRVVDITNPLAPSAVGKLNLGRETYIRDIAAAGDLACLAFRDWAHGGQDDGLAMIDVSIPSEPRMVARLATPAPARAIALAQSHALVSTGERRILVVDIADPTAPALAGEIPTDGWAKDVAVAGRYAYCIAGDRLDVLDIWNPTSPEKVASLDMMSAASVVVHGNRAYVLPDTELIGLRVVDISNPAAPRPAGEVGLLLRHGRARTDGNLLYVMGRSHSLVEIIQAQCSAPAPALTLGARLNPYRTANLELHLTSSAPLAPNTVRMRIGDAEVPLKRSDPGAGAWTGHHEILADSLSAALFACASGTEGASACAEKRFSARRFRSGQAGTLTSPDGRLTLSIHAPGLAADGYALVIPGAPAGTAPSWEVGPRELLSGAPATITITYSEGQVDDLSSLHIEESSLGPLASVVDPARRTVSATIGDLGTFSLVSGPPASGPVHDRTLLAVEPNVPNPFNPETTVRFEIGAMQHVRVAVYDTQGREIAELADRVLAAGVHRVTWDGRTQEGRAAASGLYLVRVTAEGASVTRKMLLVR